MKNIKDDISDERMHMWISLNVNIWSNLRGNVIISIGHNIGNNIYFKFKDIGDNGTNNKRILNKWKTYILISHI